MLWHNRQKPITRYSESFYGNLSEELFIMGIQYICIENSQL